MCPVFDIGETCLKYRIASEYGNPADDLGSIGMVSQTCGSWRMLVRPDDSWFIADVEDLENVDRHPDHEASGQSEPRVQVGPGETETPGGTPDGAGLDDNPAGLRSVADQDQYGEF